MTPEASELLLIQKFIFLLDDFHYQQYKSHLLKSNASLSIKLAEAVRNKLPVFDSSEALCKKIYGGTQKDQKLSFNQLGSYSFRLSNLLAVNYPGYLLSNLARMQHMVNEGDAAGAAFLAEVLLDIAERIEDFQSQVTALKFLCQRAFLLKANSEGFKLIDKLESAMENEKLYISLLSSLYKNKLQLGAAFTQAELQRLKDFYDGYLNHPSAAIRIFSQYALFNCLYHYGSKAFEPEDEAARMLSLQKEIKTNCYVIFPFLTDVKGSIDFWALNSHIHLSVFEDWKSFEELSAHYDDVKFWNSFMNVGRLNLLAAATSRFLTRYHCFVHRSNYGKLMDADDLKYMKSAIAQCEELMHRDFGGSKFENSGWTIKMIYGVLLILRGGDLIKRGIDELESMLISYQQTNLQSSVGSIYFGLMIGYFATKDYTRCAKTFARFERAAKGKSVYEGNKLKIYAYYYLSKWVLTGSKQYERKMTDLLKPFEKDNMLPRTVMELVHYNKMPVGVHYDPTPLRQ